MYEVWIDNAGVKERIHELDDRSTRRLTSCKFCEEINGIPSAVFEIYPQNPAYGKLHELSTLVEIKNTLTGEVEFEGRLLQKPKDAMSADGIVGKQYRCEGFLAYLCDSRQMYHHYEDYTPTQFLEAILSVHNDRLPDKEIVLGACDFSTTRSKTTAYRTTLAEIEENLTSRLGGEISIHRNANGKLALYYLTAGTGRKVDVTVELGKNIVEINHSTDATHLISRLIPLGAQLNDKTAERLTLEGYYEDDPDRFYIEDPAAMAEVGIVEGIVEFDDITTQQTLAEHGEDYLAENNRILHSYKAQVLDLSTIGLEMESFRIGNIYRFKCSPIGLDEDLRIIRRTVDIFEPYQPVIEIGTKTETLTDLETRAAKMIEYTIPNQKYDILATTQGMIDDLMNGGLASNVICDGHEVLIMDSDSIETATNIWRANTAGFAHATVDPEHPDEPHYNLAMLMDGTVVASFVLAGSVTAENLTITGGKVNIQASSETYDFISLNYTNDSTDGWHSHMAPLEFCLRNTGIGAEWIAQAAGMYYKNNGNDIVQIGRSGVGGSGVVRAWDDTNGKWVSLLDVASKADVNAANITTLWNAVFGS